MVYAWVQSISRSFGCQKEKKMVPTAEEECVYETSNHTQNLFPLPTLAAMESSIILVSGSHLCTRWPSCCYCLTGLLFLGRDAPVCKLVRALTSQTSEKPV